MDGVTPTGTAEVLTFLHERLDAQFTALKIERAKLEPAPPVFALEHDLNADDLGLLKQAVRAGIHDYYVGHYRSMWLPFVVYAAEMGYGYEGDEYWTTFSSVTPRWTSQERSTIRDWFHRFADQYAGARPHGAWAQHFTIISWPITHAVLPVYLQRQLARLLFEFSGALTSDLLEDPSALGLRLSSRASSYTERFRIFCENSTLVGQVAAALLSGENEATPYLTPATLARIVDGLSEERQARHWLSHARQSAIRARGFRSEGAPRSAGVAVQHPRRSTDPRLVLRYDGIWNAYAELPDLSVLSSDLPDLYGQLRLSRATVSGGARSVPPSGLLYPGQEVRLARWPRADEPLVQLDRGSEQSNRLLATQCVMTQGPWWLFRRQDAGLAIQVKGKFIRPGHQYLLIGTEEQPRPAVQWSVEMAIGAQGVKAYELDVPRRLNESDEAALRATGLAVVSSVEIRPVGLVASAWDGEGEAEWLAGEPALLGIRSDLQPSRCRVAVDGMIYFLDWHPGESELFFSLEGMSVGTHQLAVAILGEGDRQLAAGSMVLAIRDPQVRHEGASAGEGIRLLAAPARPTLSELWDGRAVATVDGPPGVAAQLGVTLHDRTGVTVTDLHRSIRLPLNEAGWRSAVTSVRKDKHFSDAYDAAESCTVTIARDGVGYARLTCERGFQPLRWRFTRTRDGDVVATIIDRTDGGRTSFEFFDISAPLTPVRKDPAEPFSVPPKGGLAIARAADVVAAAILPTNPNAVWRLPSARPVIKTHARTPREVLRLAEGHRDWMGADLPADPFAAFEQQTVGDAISRAICTLMGGSRWAAVEWKLADGKEAAEHLEEMQAAVGTAPDHKELASSIAYSLFKWLRPEDLLSGFHDVITPFLESYRIPGGPAASRFLLMLAGRPGFISEWEPGDASAILDGVLKSPVLYRAARFAVLGTRALNDAEGIERGF